MEKIIITCGPYKGRTGNLLENIEYAETLFYSLVSLLGSATLVLECNTHPVCSKHPNTEAHWRHRSQTTNIYYCQQCAAKCPHQLEMVYRHEPMNDRQLSAYLAWQVYTQSCEMKNPTQDRMQCLVCCVEQSVSVLSEGGVCMDCISQKRRIPGWGYRQGF